MALDLGRYPLDRIGELGAELAAHILFEERELFPMIENDLGAERLERLAAVVAEAEERVERWLALARRPLPA
jgi:iron-sulfur cluster repair protein YtfE (RIC family)